MGTVEVTTIGLLQVRVSKMAIVASGQTVAQAVTALALGAVEGIVPVMNGHVAAWDDTLQNGDKLELVQTVGGGC